MTLAPHATKDNQMQHSSWWYARGRDIQHHLWCSLIKRNWSGSDWASSSTYHFILPVARMVKNLPAIQESKSLVPGWEDRLEKGMAIHSSILVWTSPRTEEPGRLQSAGSQGVGHNWATNTHTPFHTKDEETMLNYTVQFSRSVVSDSLQLHELQHARPPCPSPTPEVHPNPCPSSRRCHSTISSPVIPFSSFPQSFPTSGSFPMSQLFTSGGQSIGVSASTSVLPMNTQAWSPLGWTG